jgi:hypothetical protein
MSTNNNKKTIKTPSQEAQGHRYELLLSTPVLSGQTPPPPPPRTPRTTTAAAAAGASVTKKKTLRDRKAQRYRRKLRKQRFNQRDIQMHMLRYRQQQQQQQEQIHQEDMEEMSPLNDTMATTNKSANYQVCYLISNNCHSFHFYFLFIRHYQVHIIHKEKQINVKEIHPINKIKLLSNH